MLNTEEINFPFLRVLFECRVTGPMLYFTQRRGETIKGLIAREMKKLFPCSNQAPCERCKLVDKPSDCEYVRFFRYDLSHNPFQYVIIPPLNSRSIYYNNETFSFEIRLFGECARFEYLLKYLAPAIEQGGLLSGIGTWYKEKEQHFGRFQLSGIYAWRVDQWIKIFQEKEGFVADRITPQSFREQFGSTDKEYNEILFYTPYCLRKSKEIIPEPTLDDILYFSIMRLRSVYGDRKIRIADDLCESAASVTPVASAFEKTFSAKQLSYHIGHLKFDKLPQPLYPLLELGGFCHIGKATTQGYGGFFLVPAQ